MRRIRTSETRPRPDIIPRRRLAKVPPTKHFTFNLAGALSDQLYEEARKKTLTRAPLDTDELKQVDRIPGIYQLYKQGDLVYIGKADENLRRRLEDHYRKISGRRKISTSEMSFNCLYVEGTWIPVALETMLTNCYKQDEEHGSEVSWFHSGFGMHDTGSERDTTTWKRDHWDVLYPIDLDFVVPGLTPGPHPVNEILPVIKHGLPYGFRFENQWAKHPDYLASSMTVPAGNLTATQVFDLLVSSLPTGWRVIALPGYVIMYKNTTNYPMATRIFPENQS